MVSMECQTLPFYALLGVMSSAAGGSHRGRGRCKNLQNRGPDPMSASSAPNSRLVYVVDGKRVVGYDNARGRGDHRQLDDREEAYFFVNPLQLMADFIADVKGAGL